MKAQTPWDDPSAAVPVSETMHVKHDVILERKAVVCKTKGKKKKMKIYFKIFLDCFFTRANDWVRH